MTSDPKSASTPSSVGKAVAIMIGLLALATTLIAVIIIAFGTTAAVITFSTLAILIGVAALTFSKVTRR